MNNISSNAIYLDIIDRMKSQGGFNRATKKLDDLGKALKRSEKEAEKHQLMMEKASAQWNRTYSRETKKSAREQERQERIMQREHEKAAKLREKEAIAMGNLSARTAKYDEIGKKFNLNQAETDKVLSAAGLRISKTGDVMDRAGNIQTDYDSAIRSNLNSLNKFNMNALGVMFAGMALNRTMSNLNATSREWVGMNELMSTAMGIVTLPTTMDLLNLGVLPLFDALVNLPEPAQKAIGYVSLALEGLGAVMMTGGQLMLGLEATTNMLKSFGGTTVLAGINKAAGKLSTIGKYAATGFVIGMTIKDISGGDYLSGLFDALALAGFALGGVGGAAIATGSLILSVAFDQSALMNVYKTVNDLGYAVKDIFSGIGKDETIGGGLEQFYKTTDIIDANKEIERVMNDHSKIVGDSVFFAYRDAYENSKEWLDKMVEYSQITPEQYEKMSEELEKTNTQYLNSYRGAIKYIQENPLTVDTDLSQLDDVGPSVQHFLDALETTDTPISEKTEQVDGLRKSLEKLNEAWEISEEAGGYELTRYGKKQKEITASDVVKFGFADVGREMYESVKNTVEMIKNPFKYSSASRGFAVGGQITDTGFYRLHQGETVLRKDQQGMGGNLQVTYNVTVSDKREFEKMLRANNQELTSQVRRMSRV